MGNEIQYSFRRCELKYFLTPAQQAALLDRIEPQLYPDRYGRYGICNIYYDTPDWRLVRASIEKPVYKEKLRVRSYGVPQQLGPVFIEIKKKFDGVVYKRRITAAACAVDAFLAEPACSKPGAQIENEIHWFQHRYRTVPRVFIGYDRTAFSGRENPNIRITFDTNMRWRTTQLDLRLGDGGAPLIYSDRILMEVKIPGAAPLWLSRALAEVHAVPASFSKYGACYANHILPQKLAHNLKGVDCIA